MKYYKYIDQGFGDPNTFKQLGLTEDDYFVRHDIDTDKWYTMWIIFGKNWLEANQSLIEVLEKDIQKGALIEITKNDMFIDLI